MTIWRLMSFEKVKHKFNIELHFGKLFAVDKWTINIRLKLYQKPCNR